MNADGSGRTQLTRRDDEHVDDHEPTSSPDGSLIAFSRRDHKTDYGKSEIYVMRPDGSGTRRLTFSGHGNFAGNPSFSPGGHTIVYERETRTGTRIALVAARGGGARLLPRGPYISPTFSPNGKRILAIADTVDNDRLVSMNRRGGDLRVIERSRPDGFADAAWIPRPRD
jgi:Tol biopolymer transport system component